MPGTAAAAADLRKGDIIVSVDGSPVKSAEDIQRFLAHGGPHYKIAVERNRKEMTITVTVRP
jgi:S1-C subfamily serine protease